MYNDFLIAEVNKICAKNTTDDIFSQTMSKAINENESKKAKKNHVEKTDEFESLQNEMACFYKYKLEKQRLQRIINRMELYSKLNLGEGPMYIRCVL
jgi:hypothetical protein